MTVSEVARSLVLRAANGAGLRFGAQHSQSVENWVMAIPGLKVVAPSTPADMKGLLAAARRDDDPVIVCEHKALFAEKGEVPDGEHVVRLGEAAVLREGNDVTLVALAAMVPRALAAAERLSVDHGIDADVIDLRSLIPLDAQAILRSVAKTSRLFRVEENPRGVGAQCRAGCSPWRRPRGSASGVPRSCPSSPTRVSTAWMRRSSASRLRTSPCRRGRRSNTSRSRRSTAASRRSRAVWTRRDSAVAVVGIAGTGRMGSAIARAVRAAGHDLVLWNRTQSLC